MARYIALRLLQGLIVLFLVSSATFGMMHLAPGDPIDMMVGEAEVSQAQIDIITQKWGLDQPVYRQYLTWLGNVLRGDFGTSIIRSGVPVTSMIREALPATLKLNLFALIVSLVIALPVGLLAAVKRYSLFDYLSMGGASLGVALPNFWVALMLIILFGLYLGWLPPFGLSTWKGYILPVAVLATEQMAVLARLMRGTTLEVLRQDYVATARAKGLREVMVIARHVSRNALLPVVTMLGYRIAFILSGTIVVEYVFAIGGIGRLFIDSVFRLDYQVVQALVLLFAALVVLGNLATDILYAYIDPRIRIR
jgi:ABC-type dipeptide/oligopeptide/nickel transport system permease component